MNNLGHTAALAAFLGAQTVQSLILSSKGALGLPWAIMSFFGSFHVIKGCLAGSIPCWLRETLGVNSPTCDSILGRTSTVDNKSMLEVTPDSPKGVSVRLATNHL